LTSVYLLPALSAGKGVNAKVTASAGFDFSPYRFTIYPVRIGLATRLERSHIAVASAGALFVDNKPVFALAPRYPYLLQHGYISELATGRSYKLPHDRRSYIASFDRQVWANNRWYNGCLELLVRGQRITVINLLDLEEYLGGVVPAEMPANWYPEALKAQAVAARSYAWAHIHIGAGSTGAGSKWYGSEGYDLVPDVRDQVYKGLAVRARSSDNAILATHGIVLQDSGRVKPGFYRAWVGDAFENFNMRKSTISNALLEKITGIPKIIGVTVKHWDANGNASSIQIIGAKKSREVDGIALAKMLHFSTAGILDARQQGNEWIFTYRGPGNGSRGLSQHGANMLAAHGWPFMLILQQYYQEPGGHLRFARLAGYDPGAYFRRLPVQKTKPNIKKNDEPKVDISKMDEPKADEPKKDVSKTDASTDDSKTSDSKPEDSPGE